MSRCCLGAVLAGGDARRWGGAPKGLAVVDGMPMLERVRLALTPACDGAPVLVVRHWLAWLDQIPDRWTLVFDRVEGSGPLGGIDAALAYASMHQCAGALVVAWDMPWVTVEMLRMMRARGERDDSPVVPERSGQLDPLCAYYPLAVHDRVHSALADGELGVRACVESMPNLIRFDAREFAPLGDPDKLLANMNTPRDVTNE